MSANYQLLPDIYKRYQAILDEYRRAEIDRVEATAALTKLTRSCERNDIPFKANADVLDSIIVEEEEYEESSYYEEEESDYEDEEEDEEEADDDPV